MKKHPMPPDTAFDVIDREKGRCAVCGLPVEQGHGHIHHRKPRGMGGGRYGNSISNLLYLHPSCHMRHVESQRVKAWENGWLLQHWQEPETTPLMYMLGGWVYLTDDGHIITKGDEG